MHRHIDELEWTEADNTVPVLRNDAVASIRSQIQDVLEQARALDPIDPKYERLLKIVRDKQNLPNNKVMLFSSFRHTLHYLYERLKADGLRVGMLHGGTPDEERLIFRHRFANPREDSNTLDILLFSEIGCEGLDYQFCDCIVNYDLPWNPMRVEQRIGRIDRVGQRSESIAIVNLVTLGTVDADIYERCLKRIGVFESALGSSEEILGDITKEIRSIAENYTLSEEDRRDQLQQLADNKIRLVQEQEALEQKQMELFGIRLPEDRMKREIEEASSFWLNSASIHRLVAYYLQQACGRNQEFILGERPLKTLRLSQDARTILLRDLQKLPRQNAIAYREWENWLKGAEQHLAITFESDCATEHPEAAFVMPLHPLVKQAATALLFDMDKKATAKLKVQTNEVPVGRYEFVIYQWQFHGIREDQALKPVASSDAVTPHLDRLLEKAVDAATDEQGDINSAAWDELEARHYQLWSAARVEHQQRTQELAAYRSESLSMSHQARIGLLNEQLEQANDEKIQRMRQSQIDSAEADYTRRIQELDRAMERADVVHEPVAYGALDRRGNTMNLQELRQERLKWVEATRANNFEEGIKGLLTDLYPDNAHFIYELLQNAEDAQATEVRFVLQEDKVEFEHNGDLLFSIEDVEAITGLGISTKKDDLTNIGKFGVGFKAVFAYTSTPEIRSGAFNFRIRDLVVPDTDRLGPYALGDKDTRFSFLSTIPKNLQKQLMLR